MELDERNALNALVFAFAILVVGPSCTGLKKDDVRSSAPDASSFDAAVSGATSPPAMQPTPMIVPNDPPERPATAADAGGATRDGGCTDALCACDPGSECCVDQDCSTGQLCLEGACRCPADTHRCAEGCVSDSSSDSCGQACEPCQKPVGGSAMCNAGRCEPACPARQRPCAGTCIDDSAACSAQCPGATHDCSGVCLANDSVNGCGASSCTPCPAPAANGHATCDGAACDIACDDGYERCANDCIREADCCTAQDCGGTGWFCSSGHQCECASDHKSCKGGCIELSRCCEDADCGSSQACQGGACVATNWCAQRARPGGVAATDYRCVDFEAGLPPSSEWTQQVVGAGTLELSTASASSLPSSARAAVEAESSAVSADRATLSFSAVGGSSVTSASVAIDINPSSSPSFANPWTGGVDVLCVSNSVNELCLGYTISQDIVGFFLSQSYSGGIAFFDQCPISAAIPANNWTRVELRVSTTSAVSMLIGGAAASTGSCTMRIDPEASLNVTIGLRSNPITAAGWSLGFDNAEAIVRR